MDNRCKGVVFFIFSLMLCSCSGGEKGMMGENINKRIHDVPSAQWQQLAKSKIFWGHQSVGSNIIGGLQELLSANAQIPLKVEAVKQPYTLAIGTLSHDHVGTNGDPSSKIKDFVRIVEGGVGAQVDTAFFKFCFIDFNGKTDVQQVCTEYKKALQGLKAKYPAIQFMHATVPLVKVETGPKAWVKKILGRTLDGTKDNVKRHEFNEMLRAEYSGKDPIFDIAKYESTRPDGSRETFELDGKRYFALVPAYTSDGGHLNTLGSRYLASELLFVLVDASVR